MADVSEVLPRIGLALIARDEADTLPRLLASIEGAFDRVVLIDTGSTDDTLAVFNGWAHEEHAAGRLDSHRAAHFVWRDDFGAARARADQLLLADGELDWTCWADCDDEIHGATNLRRLAAATPPEVVALIADYDYARDDHGNSICRLRRERLVRAGHGQWAGRIHEHQLVPGPHGILDRTAVEWVHHKPLDENADHDRNLRILQAWQAEEPDQPRVLSYLGFEELSRGHHGEAIGWFERYLSLPSGWDEERAQVHRRYALALRGAGRPADAVATALEAIRLMPSWPDSYLTLAEAHYELDEHAKAVEWAREVLRRGVPHTALIVNPQDYDLAPKVILAGALARLGDLEQAVGVADEVLAALPEHPVLAGPYRQWRGQLKRKSTAETFIGAADVLVAHDEQANALAVLEAAPHYATDWPALVEARSRLRERVGQLTDPDAYHERYVTGGSKPEGMVDDDQVMALGDALPRCGFLLAGVRELAGVAA